MAQRTVRRAVRGVNTDTYENYEESLGYFNFAEFKGIDSNENYVTKDQQTFESVKNVYVDQNDQLHTRPPLKRYFAISADYNVSQIFKVNNLTIYKATKDNKCYLVFLYNGEPVSSPEGFFTNPKHIINKSGVYIVFDTDAIKGFELVNGTWQWYTTDKLVYKPITQISQGGEITEGEKANILYDGTTTRYIFNKEVTTPLVNLIDKTLHVTIDDDITDMEPFEADITFVNDQDKVFTKIINEVTIDADFVSCTKVANTDILYYLAYDKSAANCQLSLDGRVFTLINFPTSNCKSPVISDDGSSLFVLDVSDNKLYYMPITQTEQGSILGNFQAFNVDMPSNNTTGSPSLGMNMLAGETGTHQPIMISTKYSDIQQTTIDNFIPFGHSPESSYCCYITKVSFTRTVYNNTSLGYSESGQISTGTRYGFVMIIYNAGNVSTYLMSNENPTEWTQSDLVGSDANRVRMILGGSEFAFNMIVLSAPYFDYNIIYTNVNWLPYYALYVYYNSEQPTSSYTRSEQRFTDQFDYHLVYNNTGYYNFDILTKFNNETSRFEIKTATLSNIASITIDDIELIIDYDSSNYALKFTYTDVGDSKGRDEFPVLFHTENVTETITAEAIRISDSANWLSSTFFHYNGQDINLIRPTNKTNIKPVYTDGSIIVYYDAVEGYIYTSDYEGNVTADLTVDGSYANFVPDLVTNFITIAASVDNILYWSTDIKEEIELSDGTKHIIPKLYFEDGNDVNLPSLITALTVFSQTSLGVFLQNNVYELQYSTDNSVYILTPTKLQLGNKEGADVLLNYDGASIFITNLKGLIALTYQDFVQSTEQVYTYLTEAMMSEYDKFATAPIKLYQYKDWLFMYKQNANDLYMYDIRNASWWYWVLPYNIQQIIFDNSELNVLVDTGTENLLLYFDFETEDFRDLTDTIIEWQVTSQKLHFNAPNNYKHIRQISIITTQNTCTQRYKLKFVNYHNLDNLVDYDTVEYDINQLTTMIKRVTFMKTNAFQFIISNDKTDKDPKYFETPNIAIKYRITERVR